MSNQTVGILLEVVFRAPGVLLLTAAVVLGVYMIVRFIVRFMNYNVQVEAEIETYVSQESYNEHSQVEGYLYAPVYRYVYEGVTYLAKPHSTNYSYKPTTKTNADGKVVIWINPKKPELYRQTEEEICVTVLVVVVAVVLGVIGALLLMSV